MSDASKRLEKADKYLQKGKVEEALAELLAAADADPENNLVCERAADICISQNRNKEAAELLGSLFDRLSASGEQAKALVTYKKLARISSPRVEQTFRFAQYLEKSNKKEAAELFQKAAEGFVAADQKGDAPAERCRAHRSAPLRKRSQESPGCGVADRGLPGYRRLRPSADNRARDQRHGRQSRAQSRFCGDAERGDRETSAEYGIFGIHG